MPESESERHDPAEIFRPLREGPVNGPDSHDLWRRVEAGLTPRLQARRPLAWRRLAYGLAAAATIVVAVSLGFYMKGPLVVTEGAAEGGTVVDDPVEAIQGLVFLAEEEAAAAEVARAPAEEAPTPAADAAPSAPRRFVVDVRLVRGFDGVPPEDALSGEALAGAGGASAVGDIRPQLLPVLPFDDYALVGRGRADVIEGEDVVAQLSDELSLALTGVNGAVSEEDGRLVRFAGLRLVGAGRPRVAGDLALVAGRLYLFGIHASGETTPSLVLAVRVSAAEEDG